MRILALSKRQYMSRDLLDDRYGRFREIPLAMARRGHDVRGLCLSYRHRTDYQRVDSDSEAIVPWESVNLGKTVISGLFRFVRHGRKIMNRFRPNIIWAGSDSFYGPLALLIGKNSDSQVIFDVYDHFETFASTKIPGVFPLYRHACRTADGVTSFSEPMSDHITRAYHRTGPLLTLVNGTDKRLFYPRDKSACRDKLGLPLHVRLVGTAGALSQSHGIATLFSAFETLAREDMDIHMVIAGPRDHDLRIPLHPHLHDLGVLPFDEVPTLLNALDVGVISHRDTPAGRFGFPFKAYEMMACKVPLVAANVGAMIHLLEDCPACLYEPDNPDELGRAIRYQLATASISNRQVPDWNDIAAEFDAWLHEVSGMPRQP
jgi:glycosyltransferase involved in cell wall biosynthesis